MISATNEKVDYDYEMFHKYWTQIGTYVNAWQSSQTYDHGHDHNQHDHHDHHDHQDHYDDYELTVWPFLSLPSM